MNTELNLSSLVLFVLASSITPGPNNLLLMRSGARFGFAPTGPHILGIAIGMVGLTLLSHLGIASLVLAVPEALTVLRWACFGYLLWLA
ncbi:MAG: LysE family transporter, partial [Steroidobacteraceae bacterium]